MKVRPGHRRKVHVASKQKMPHDITLNDVRADTKRYVEVLSKKYGASQPLTQASSRYPSDQRKLGTERDSVSPRRIFPTSLTGDVTSEIAEDVWERGWGHPILQLAKSTSATRL